MCVIPLGGAFVYKRLAFGLCNGPSSYQRLTDHILSGLDNVFAYMDDFLIYNEDEESHMKTLEDLFKRLEEFGMTLL